MTNPDLTDSYVDLTDYFGFFEWLSARNPVLIEGTVGLAYPAATSAIAARVGFRPARPAESVGSYLSALRAHITAPPPLPIQFAGPEPETLPALRPGEVRLLLVCHEVPAGTQCDDLPIRFTGSEPAPRAHCRDTWPRHFFLPQVEWPVAPSPEDLAAASACGIHGTDLAQSVIDYFLRPPAPPMADEYLLPSSPPAPRRPQTLAALRAGVIAAALLGLPRPPRVPSTLPPLNPPQ